MVNKTDICLHKFRLEKNSEYFFFKNHFGIYFLTLARKARNLKIFNYLEKDFRLIYELFWPRIRKIQSILT